MKMLILGLNYSPEIIGTGLYTGKLAQYLAGQKHEVRTVTSPPYYPEFRIRECYSGWRYTRESWQGVEVIRCPLWVPRRISNLNRIPHLLSFAKSSLPIILMQALWKPDLVLCIVPTMFCAPTALLLARLSGAKSWLHVQDYELDAALSLDMLTRGNLLVRLAQLFERYVMIRFDRVSTISNSMRMIAIKKGVRQERTITLPNWVDTNQIRPLSGRNPLREELNLPQEARVVLYHGNMGRKQGLEILIAAAAQLRGELDVIFLLCGEGSFRAELERKAKGLNNVRIIGLVPEEKLNQLVNLADIHVLPQRAGATDSVMPSKLATMLASGKPVIACTAPDSQLWKLVDQVGITVPPECPQELASAILRLMNDPIEQGRLSRLGREYACQYLEKEKILSEFESAILELARE